MSASKTKTFTRSVAAILDSLLERHPHRVPAGCALLAVLAGNVVVLPSVEVGGAVNYWAGECPPVTAGTLRVTERDVDLCGWAGVLSGDM